MVVSHKVIDGLIGVGDGVGGDEHENKDLVKIQYMTLVAIIIHCILL